MKTITYRTIFLCLVFFFATSIQANSQLPVEYFSKHKKFHNIVISPDGKHLAASINNRDGKQAVIIMQRNGYKVTGVINWSGNEIPLDMYWVNDERIAVEVGIKLGVLDQPVKTGEVVAMNFDGTKKKMIFGARKKKGIAVNVSIAKMYVSDFNHDDPKHITILSVPASEQGRAGLYRLNVYSGKMRRIAISPTRGGMLLADHNGVARFATGNKPENGINKNYIYYRENKSSDWQQLDSYIPDNGFMTPIMFSKDNKSVIVASNIDTPQRGLYKYDIATQKRTPLFVDANVDIDDMDFDVNKKLYAVHTEPDYSKVTVLDKDHMVGKWYPSLIKSFNGSKVRITSATLDMKQIVLKVTSDKDPGTFYLFDVKNQKLVFLMKAKPWLEEQQLATTEAFSFKARDGITLFGYLTLPKGKSSNLPLIVLPHGGPHGPRDYWTYDDDAQFLASRGYAVLKVNFRGSGGYGRNFQTMGYQQWGGKIIDDITDATHWAVQEGVADKNRMCIFGASFGGYASLMSVVKEPDLFKCALGYVGVYDMDLLHTTGDISQRKSGSNFLNKVIGHNKDKLNAYSPARHVEKIKADLFIVHGEKDIRAHYDHALLLKDRLDKAGKSYQWLTKPKEGHGFYKEEHREELYQKMAAFFDKNIGL